MIEMGRAEEVIREMDKLANEDHTHTTLPKKKSMCTVAMVDPFEFSWFRHDAHEASS